MDLIDSHSHLDVDQFDADRAAAIDRAVACGVRRQILPAIAVSGFEKLRVLCRDVPGLIPAYGLHPMFLSEHCRAHIAELREWIQREKPAAVGECGLDFYLPDADRQSQTWFFDQQLHMAVEFSLPVIVHARRAVEEVILALRAAKVARGVVHSFSGSAEQAHRLWNCGFMLGIGGPITYPRAIRLRKIVAAMPLEFLLLETDAPDQPLFGHQGARNEPARLVDVCQCIAQLRGQSSAEIAAATTANAQRLFNLDNFAA